MQDSLDGLCPTFVLLIRFRQEGEFRVVFSSSLHSPSSSCFIRKARAVGRTGPSAFSIICSQVKSWRWGPGWVCNQSWIIHTCGLLSKMTTIFWLVGKTWNLPGHVGNKYIILQQCFRCWSRILALLSRVICARNVQRVAEDLVTVFKEVFH